MAADKPYLRLQKLKAVEEAYAAMRPLLEEGRVEEARDMIDHSSCRTQEYRDGKRGVRIDGRRVKDRRGDRFDDPFRRR